MTAYALLAGLSAMLAFYDLNVAVPCALRWYNLKIRREPMSEGVSENRRKAILTGIDGVALATFTWGLTRTYAAWCWIRGKWTVDSETAVWAVIAVVNLYAVLCLLRWGYAMAHTDSPAGARAALRVWRWIVGLGLAVGAIVAGLTP